MAIPTKSGRINITEFYLDKVLLNKDNCENTVPLLDDSIYTVKGILTINDWNQRDIQEENLVLFVDSIIPKASPNPIIDSGDAL